MQVPHPDRLYTLFHPLSPPMVQLSLLCDRMPATANRHHVDFADHTDVLVGQ
jgi:hypothetical protein